MTPSTQISPPAAEHFRRVAGHHPTGAVLIAAPRPTPQDTAPAMIVGTFASVSLHPPLVGFLPAKTSTSWPRIRRAGRFSASVLAADQVEVCRGFAAADPRRWEVPHWETEHGSPVLLDALAWFECDLAGEVEAGDHVFVTGLVRGLGVQRVGAPLVFFRGGYDHGVDHRGAARGRRSS